jgi:DNA-binding transcriptional regulator YdaS (Cro superfamily)
MRPTPIDEAIKRAGSVKALAEAAGVRPQAISQWQRIPTDRVVRISEALGIPRHKLRPDLYEQPAAPSEAA